jgi:hypothetical protein
MGPAGRVAKGIAAGQDGRKLLTVAHPALVGKIPAAAARDLPAARNLPTPLLSISGVQIFPDS